ncbi:MULTISPECIES: aspartate/glutamate racemase family protein [unclassified Endozoicomonas]|uniref:aspartate/glutamate racemase family protein n=2 Tax=Endozoicomonas TaxID=305899 RepID=UPI003BB7D4F6
MKIGSQKSMPSNPVEKVSRKSSAKASTGHSKGRSVTTTALVKPPYLSLGEKAKSSNIVQALRTVFSFGLIKDRNITVVQPDGTKLKQSISINQLAREGYISVDQKAQLLAFQSSRERGEKLAAILQEVDQQLLSTKPQKSETEHDWTRRVISEHSIQPRKKYCQQRISLEIEPDQISYYNDLQQTIAKLIPKESQRPTIDLHIVGKSARKNNCQRSQLGVLGGMGPLSDAKIVTRALDDFFTKGGDKDHLVMNLFSCPPPRTLWEVIASGSSFIDNIRTFAARRHRSYVIASNAAHAKCPTLKKLGIKPLLHLVDQIASRIAKDQVPSKNTTTLVLETTQAYKNKLYSLTLRQQGVDSINLSQTDQKVLQQLIDHTKRTGGSDKQEELSSMIRQYVNSERKAGREVGHVLLGCTELPMALGKEKMEELEAELQVNLVNTEAVFAEIFADKLTEAYVEI